MAVRRRSAASPRFAIGMPPHCDRYCARTGGLPVHTGVLFSFWRDFLCGLRAPSLRNTPPCVPQGEDGKYPEPEPETRIVRTLTEPERLAELLSDKLTRRSRPTPGNKCLQLFLRMVKECGGGTPLNKSRFAFLSGKKGKSAFLSGKKGKSG